MQTDAPAESTALSELRMPAPGDLIADKYRVEAVLGRGGMSVVYRATHLQLDQQVAIKVLSAAALMLPEYVVRLRREARAVSRIRSEHVVKIHDIGALPDGGVPYLVMEYLSGLDLAAVLTRRGPFNLALAVDCIMQACEALAEAHALGIVHRDLKPANLFLAEAADGSPCLKVLDFGISRMARRHGLSPLTDPGIVLGTPNYMAPEQMEAADTVDERSDIWALGTILYELLVGRRPYTGDSLPQIFLNIMRTHPPKASELRHGIPADVDAVIARCLAVEPADRFQTVAELAWALSKLGAPHARDSAARIARVLDRHSAEAIVLPSLAGMEPQPVVKPIDDDRRARRRPTLRAISSVASATLLGAALVFGTLALRGATEHGSPSPQRSVQQTKLEPEIDTEGTAVAISSVLRPLPVELGPPVVPAPARVVAPPARLVVSIPARKSALSKAVSAGDGAAKPERPSEAVRPPGAAPRAPSDQEPAELSDSPD